MEKVQIEAGTGNQTDSYLKKALSLERLAENVGGVAHNLKSTLMAVNGFLDLLGAENHSEIHEQAKRSTEAMETILSNLVFVLQAYRKTEPEVLSLNACVRSTAELLQTNGAFPGKVMFELELDEDDGIYAVLADVMVKLDLLITSAAEHVLAGGQQTCVVATVCERRLVCVRVGSVVTGFPRSS